jgi:hypothetical protein
MLLTERYADRILGVLRCFDRVIITGTLPDFGHAEAATRHLYMQQVRIFDFAEFAKPLREEIRSNAERLAREAGIEIEYLRKSKGLRKEQRIREILAERGDAPGLVHIFSVMETCTSYKPWHDKRTHRTFLRPDSGKCVHYYFYFIDEVFGLCHLRVPTWAPYRVQFYFNGHNWLASELRKRNIGFRLLDNAFVDIDNFGRAQKVADQFQVKRLHRFLNQLVASCCPVVEQFPAGYHWSLMQAEYATDIVFGSRADLAAVYDTLVRTAIHAVKAEDVATFLGRKVDARYTGELGTDYHTRIQGTRVKHHMGKSAIKMYDKFGRILRLETVTNDVSFFKHYREVVHRDGSTEWKLAPVKKSIYSLPALAELLAASNRRYLEFLSSLDDVSAGARRVDHISRTVQEGTRRYRGFNVLDSQDRQLFEILERGEFNISGFQNRDLRRHLPGWTAPQTGRLLKRLRTHGLVKKVGNTYKYYLTKLGRRVVAAALAIHEFILVPELARA